jgi:hypothetical protein
MKSTMSEDTSPMAGSAACFKAAEQLWQASKTL